ncbi:Signal recognition particle receptor subunit beta [Erysiphe neolycopersici]|uniref:Signal recognition particle receptor subunit beta n=1 Tax=Erysiphe neolycopersici TaxID=212602 RepID=A0A420HU21_9PEZI|nr:Signal recognition particle receptor subunit beta [Erysiphe neolycopersici]
METTIATGFRRWITPSMDQYSYELMVALLLVLTIPFILHYYFFRSSGYKTTPSILLLGPCDSGKTSLITLLKLGQKAETHSSQISTTVKLVLPSNKVTGSDKYRSINDPSHYLNRKFLLTDTPGHGKLRYIARQNITNLPNLKGIIFVVDAARLKPGDEYLRHTAEYLYEVFLLLKKKAEKSNYLKMTPVLIAANKMDLFTALSREIIQKNLESEIFKLHIAKSNGLQDSGIIEEIRPGDGRDELLGEKGLKSFQFSQLEESINVPVDILCGHVKGKDPQIEEWWTWIARQL